MRQWMILVWVTGCTSGKIESDEEVNGGSFSLEDIEQLCNEEAPISVKLAVEFPATDPDCPWDTADNLPIEQGAITARIEQTAELALPEGVVVCGMDYDFLGPSGGTGTPIVYDDNFYFTFDDVLLATSYEPAVDWFETREGLPLYAWDSLVGQEFDHGNTESWCLGDDDDRSDCEIPPTETRGVMSLSFDPDLVNELSLRALQEDRYVFSFITTGDNDPESDCSHEDFAFEVEVGYVRAR
jgi:hypothetical protein